MNNMKDIIICIYYNWKYKNRWGKTPVQLAYTIAIYGLYKDPENLKRYQSQYKDIWSLIKLKIGETENESDKKISI